MGAMRLLGCSNSGGFRRHHPNSGGFRRLGLAFLRLGRNLGFRRCRHIRRGPILGVDHGVFLGVFLFRPLLGVLALFGLGVGGAQTGHLRNGRHWVSRFHPVLIALRVTLLISLLRPLLGVLAFLRLGANRHETIG